MITQEQILRYLHKYNWFRPSSSNTTITITDDNGNPIKVVQSYYHSIGGVAKIKIRVSDHGTYLDTWVRRLDDPSQSLQNLSVVFSNGPVNFQRKTQPTTVIDANGNEIEQYIYFVVEQYVYRIDNLSMKDFKKIINNIKRLEQQGVFRDPLKRKPSKRARRTVLSPTDKKDNEIPNTNNPIHPRQNVVDANRNNEVDEFGNVVKEIKKNEQNNRSNICIRLTETQFMNMLTECISKIIKEIA